jgi:hypothetical protein
MTTALGVVSLTPSIRLVFEEASSAKQGTVHGKPSSEWPPSPNGDQPTARSRPIGVGVVTGRVDVGWQHQQRGGCHATEPDHRPADPGPLPPWPWRPAHRDALAVQQRRRPRPAVAVGGDLKEVQSLPRPAMTYLRGQRRGRPTVRLARGHRRWLHPTRGRPTRRGGCLAPRRPSDAGGGSASAGIRNWTAWHTATAAVSGSGCAKPAGWRYSRTPTIPTSLAQGLGLQPSRSQAPRPAAHRTSCHVRGGDRKKHQASALVAGAPEAAGHLSGPADRRGHQPGHVQEIPSV